MRFYVELFNCEDNGPPYYIGPFDTYRQAAEYGDINFSDRERFWFRVCRKAS